MRKGLSILFSDVKEFLCNEVNRTFLVSLMILAVVIIGQYRTEKHLTKITNQNNRIKREVLSEVKTNRTMTCESCFVKLMKK